MSPANEDRKETESTALPKPQANAKAHKGRWVAGAAALVMAAVLAGREITKNGGRGSGVAALEFAVPRFPGRATNAVGIAQAAKAGVGTTLGALAEVNSGMVKSDAVFLLLPGKEAVAGSAPIGTLQAAVRTIEKQGVKCGLFTLQAGSSDYEAMCEQMRVPGVIALVRGGGIALVSGELTETKLVQGYLEASQARGCCGSGATPE